MPKALHALLPTLLLIALTQVLACHFFAEDDECDIDNNAENADDDNGDDDNDADDDSNNDDDDANDDVNDDADDDDVNDDADDDADDDSQGTFRLLSPTLREGDFIPASYTCDTNLVEYPNGVSPPLGWVYPPDGAQSLVALMINESEDNRVHWALINIPADCQYLDEALSPESADLPGDSWETRNDFDTRGYRGPCPPVGVLYTYRIEILALDRMIEKPADQQVSYAAIAQEVDDALIESSSFEVFYQH